MTFEEWLDRLVEHEIAYAGMVAGCERTPHAWFLTAPQVPGFRDANRALRLRADGKSAGEVAREVVAYYRSRGLPPRADVDPVAEEQGIGAALRRLGVLPIAEDRVLMRLGTERPPTRATAPGITVEVVPNSTGWGEADEWVETAVADDVGGSDEALWRTVAEHEARFPACRLYLARVDGQAGGAAVLFSHAGWGRIDSVATRLEFRRRGVATALMAAAISDSATSENFETYLFTEHGSDAERLYRRLGFEIWHANVMRRHRG
jgi:GNAT superfamily N-acetyltransferase